MKKHNFQSTYFDLNRIYATMWFNSFYLFLTMATKSKYQDQQLDTLLNDLIIVLEKHKAPVDLSLMALGNTVTNILVNSVPNPQQQKMLAEAFCSALQQSLANKK